MCSICLYTVCLCSSDHIISASCCISSTLPYERTMLSMRNFFGSSVLQTSLICSQTSMISYGMITLLVGRFPWSVQTVTVVIFSDIPFTFPSALINKPWFNSSCSRSIPLGMLALWITVFFKLQKRQFLLFKVLCNSCSNMHVKMKIKKNLLGGVKNILNYQSETIFTNVNI